MKIEYIMEKQNTAADYVFSWKSFITTAQGVADIIKKNPVEYKVYNDVGQTLITATEYYIEIGRGMKIPKVIMTVI